MYEPLATTPIDLRITSQGTITQCPITFQKFVEKLRSQTKIHMFDPANLIPILGFLMPFKLARNANHIHDGQATWKLSSFFADHRASPIDRRMG